MVNFTGSVATFQHINMEVAKNLPKFKTFPAMIGECGGKNYHFVHNSADVKHVAVGTIRSAFEYGGQKCSACSRLFNTSSSSSNHSTLFQNNLILGPIFPPQNGMR